jgi:hypothetical protein
MPLCATTEAGDGLPHAVFDDPHGEGGESCAMLGIKRQHGFPQGNATLLRQVVVGHTATVLPLQDKVYQSLVVQHQGLRASLAASLGTTENSWPFQVSPAMH